MKTWVIEVSIVGTILAIVVLLTGGALVEWIGACAVLFGFMHAQVSDRMAERQAILEKPDVECYNRANYYWIAKEALWITFFLIHHSFAALTGAIVFITYPLWRKLWRNFRPLKG